jgi:hypothetical protein
MDKKENKKENKLYYQGQFSYLQAAFNMLVHCKY